MTDRNLDFKVHQPQLEETPGRFKGGVRRYQIQKNEASPGFLIGGSSHSLISNSLSYQSSKLSPIGTPSPRFHWKQPPKKSPALEGLAARIEKIRSPVQHSYNDFASSRVLELMSHPAFRQPMFTKLKPKVQNSNPITGLSTTPDPRILAKSGARMVEKTSLY
jgi:hypothetical protein